MANTSLIITYSDPFLQGTTRDGVQLGSKGILCLRYSEHPISQTMKGIAEQIVGVSLDIRKVLMVGDRL